MSASRSPATDSDRPSWSPCPASWRSGWNGRFLPNSPTSIPPSKPSPAIWQAPRNVPMHTSWPERRRDATNRSRSSASDAAFPAQTCSRFLADLAAGRHRCHQRSSRRSLQPRRISTIPIRLLRAKSSRAAAASSTTSTSSTPHFFGISPREAARMDPQQRAVARSRVGSARGRRPGCRPSGRHQDRRVHRHLEQRLRPHPVQRSSIASTPTPAPATR